MEATRTAIQSQTTTSKETETNGTTAKTKTMMTTTMTTTMGGLASLCQYQSQWEARFLFGSSFGRQSGLIKVSERLEPDPPCPPMQFDLQAPFQPAGDQPAAIEQLIGGLRSGEMEQVLMGVTGSGKTFTMANVIQQVQRPTLVLSHNKTLAAQLYSEFKEFFPHNAVSYFVSYYDYYQPEAYIPQRDIYIEKDASINEEIDRMRLATTSALVSRRDVIVVASVSCIYGLGSPEDYKQMMVGLRVGQEIDRDIVLTKLVDIQYERNDTDPDRGKFRVRGDCVEIWPSYEEFSVRIEFWGDEIERLSIIDPTSGEVIDALEEYYIYPAKHFVLARGAHRSGC